MALREIFQSRTERKERRAARAASKRSTAAQPSPDEKVFDEKEFEDEKKMTAEEREISSELGSDDDGADPQYWDVPEADALVADALNHASPRPNVATILFARAAEVAAMATCPQEAEELIPVAMAAFTNAAKITTAAPSYITPLSSDCKRSGPARAQVLDSAVEAVGNEKHNLRALAIKTHIGGTKVVITPASNKERARCARAAKRSVAFHPTFLHHLACLPPISCFLWKRRHLEIGSTNKAELPTYHL